jgi:glycosyltransferase involved in cell wall biosynthesis
MSGFEKERVALFLPSLGVGGVERNTLRLAQGFLERHIAVDLVLAKAEGEWLSRVPQGIRVVDLGTPRALLSLPGLAGYLHRERPVALLAAKDYINIIAILAKQLSRVRTRVVVSVRIHLSRDAHYATSFRARLMPLLVRLFYRWADEIVAVSEGVAVDLAHITGLPRERIRVIYNPVVHARLLERASEPIKHGWFAAGEAPVIIGVGRITRQKDFVTLVQAFALVRARRPVRLMILGEGEERPILEALVRELGLEQDVALPGFVDDPCAYMARAAVFVLSSLWEGLPTALIEAMALGTPVVSTDCPSGPAEILEGGKWGKLVPVGSVTALARAIEDTLDQPPDSRALQRRAAEFSVDRAVDRYLELLVGGSADTLSQK